MHIDVEKFQLQDGDVLLIRGKVPIESFRKLTKEIRRKGLKRCLIINAHPNIEISKIPEEEMNKYGWYRKSTS